MQSCRFFVSNFKFQISLKTVHTIFKKFAESLYTHRGPCVRKRIKILWLGCEKLRQNYLKIFQKTASFRFFFDFLKNCPYYSKENLYSHFTPYYGPLCVISLISYGWDVRNIAKINPKFAKNSHLRLFCFSQKLYIQFQQNFLQ